MNKQFMICFAMLLALPTSALAFNFDGKLVDATNVPLTSPATLRIQVLTPGVESCLLYDETQSATLDSEGRFSIRLNDGNGTRNDSNGWSFYEAFSNRKSFTFPAPDCASGTTYNPGATDERVMKVMVNGTPLTPNYKMSATPLALDSFAVGGFTPAALLRVETAGTLGNISPITSTQHTELMALISGTSAQYTQAGELNGFALPSLTSNQSIRWSGGTWQAYTPMTSESDPLVSGFAKAALPTCGAGEVLKGDGTTLTCVTDDAGGSPVDATDTVKGIMNVPVAGGLVVSSGSLGLPTIVSPNTYTKVQVDNKGRVEAGFALAQADIPILSSAGKVSGDAITSGTIGGSTAISTSGAASVGSLVSGSTIMAGGMINGGLFQAISENNTPSQSSSLEFRRARGSLGSPVVVDQPDRIGIIRFSGYDGTGYLNPANISAIVDGAVSPSTVPAALTFSTGTNTPTEHMRISSSGNVGIGTQSPAVALDVNGDIQYTGTLTDVSDRRLKSNIRTLNGALEKFDHIRGVSFEMIDDSNQRTEYGVIAQEVEPHFPELVKTKNDKMGSKSVNYIGFIGWLIEAVKELSNNDLNQADKIDQLEADVYKLETENQKLKLRLEDLERKINSL